MTFVDCTIGVQHRPLAVDLIVKPAALILLTISPYELTLALHLLLLEVALVEAAIRVYVSPVALLHSIDKVALVRATVEVCFSAFALKLAVDFDTFLIGGLTCDWLSHGNDDFGVISPLNRKLRPVQCLLILFLNNGKVLCRCDLISFCLEGQIWTATFQLILGVMVTPGALR